MDEGELRKQEDASSCKSLVAAMTSRYMKAAAWLTFVLTRLGRDVIVAAESTVRTLPADMHLRIKRWLDLIVFAHDNTEMFIEAELATVGIELTAAEIATLNTNVVWACQWADDKVKKHIQDPKTAGFALLKPFLRRHMWAVDNMRSFRLPLDDAESLQAHFEAPINSVILQQCSEYNEAAATWRASDLPVEHALDCVAFWAAMLRRKQFPLISTAAVRALTVGYSNIVAERSFSSMRNLEVNNRLTAKAAYLRNYLLLKCNGHSLYELHSRRASEITAVQDILRPILLPTRSATPRSTRPRHASTQEAPVGAPAQLSGTEAEELGCLEPVCDADDDDSSGMSDCSLDTSERE